MKLKKNLEMVDVFSLTAGTMMSSGLFILPGLAHAKAGPAVVLAYFLAGLLAIPGLLSQAELASAMPRSGGSYYFITRSLGPAIGTVYGIITWFALSLKSSFALVGMTVFAGYLLGINEQAIAIGLTMIFMLLNIMGVKEAGRVQVFLVFTILLFLGLYFLIGLPEVKASNITPFVPYGKMSVLATAGFVFISYGGLLKIASIGEEVKNPGKVIPLSMIFAMIVVSLAYILVIFVTVGVLDAAKLNMSLTPISDGAAVLMGKPGFVIMGIVAIIAFSSAANAGIMAASRYPMALGRDELLPEFFGRVSRRFQTPWISVLFTGLFIAGTLFLELDVLVKSASSVVILTYTFSCLSVIILRESRVQNYQPQFGSPLYPYIQIAGIIGTLLLLVEIGFQALLISLGLILFGMIVYVFYGRKRVVHEYALMHLIERMTDRQLTSHSLETELKNVIRERDDITRDRFDTIIENSKILDIDEKMDVTGFFRVVAEAMSDRVMVKPGKLHKQLIKREEESSTALTGFMAVPHMVIDGKHIFDICIVRSKRGVYFSDESPSVKAIFILLGTRDERTFHLRSLAAIAQIVQNPDFENRWMNARGVESLRDVVLLAKRGR